MGIISMWGNLNKSIINNELDLETVVFRNNEIDDTDIDGEKVMMDLEKGKYYMINEVGSRIWDIINRPIKVNDIIEALLSEYHVEVDECKETVLEFLGELRNDGLIEVS